MALAQVQKKKWQFVGFAQEVEPDDFSPRHVGFPTTS